MINTESTDGDVIADSYIDKPSQRLMSSVDNYYNRLMQWKLPMLLHYQMNERW